MRSNYIYAKLPQLGLCNMLFTWARAEIARMQTGDPMLAPAWFKPFRIGPIIRNERYTRYYLNDFSNTGYVRGLKKRILLLIANHISEQQAGGVASQPAAGSCNGMRPTVICYEGMNAGFRPLLAHNDAIRDGLLRIVNTPIQRVLNNDCESRYIGVHVRRGDFHQVNQVIRTEWYYNTCLSLRKHYGPNIPIRIFTDAKPEEIDLLHQLGNALIMPEAPAVQDLIMLSRSLVIVGTSLSTFSLWSSFLGLRPTIWSPVSPGVHGYGLATQNHIYADWDGHFDCSKLLH